MAKEVEVNSDNYEVDESLPLISEDEMKEAYGAIYEFTINMDFGMVESVLNNLKNYRLTPNDEVLIKQVNDSLMMLDWDSIEAVVKDKR